MRDPNFQKGTLGRHLALGKTRFGDPRFSIFGRHFKGLIRTSKVLERTFSSIVGCWKIKNRFRRARKKSESLFFVLKTVKNDAKTAENGEKPCENTPKALKTSVDISESLDDM